jgi:hypothetical protein
MFVIATEDTYAPLQYFQAFKLSRIKIHVVPTVDGCSSASAVLSRLKAEQEKAKRCGDIQEGDQFWMVCDTDHYSEGSHVRAFSAALKEARDAGFQVAVTNPCFELWLLLHVADAPPPPADAAAILELLNAALGQYNKTNIPATRFLDGLGDALKRARMLDIGATGWPQSIGTQMHLLIEELLPRRSPS